jgi:hypothetical protein
MAAAISATVLRHKRSIKAHKSIVNEPLSFHVTFLLGRDFVLPAGCSSVDVLRKPLLPHIKSEPSSEAFDGPRGLTRANSHASGNITAKVSNLTGTKLELWTKKFKNSLSPNEDIESAWQERLVIITEKRIFLITKKQSTLSNQRAHDSAVTMQRTSKKVEYEIVDSIPMEEIVTIDDVDPAKIVSDPEPSSTVHHANSFFSRNLLETATSLRKRNNNRPTTQPSDGTDAHANADVDAGTNSRRADARNTGSRQALPAGAGEDYCEQVRPRRGVRDRAAGAAEPRVVLGLWTDTVCVLNQGGLARPRSRSVLGFELTRF